MRSFEMTGNGPNSDLDQNGYSSSLLEGYDEPEILPSSIRQICLTGADVEQLVGACIIESKSDCRNPSATTGSSSSEKYPSPYTTSWFGHVTKL
jgi:hypothetical protein